MDITNYEKRNQKEKMTLLYRLTVDGDRAETFHNKCNNQGPTLSLIRNTRGYRCGGFTNQNWSGRYDPNYGGNAAVNEQYAFLFSLEFKEKYPSYDRNNVYMIVRAMTHALGQLQIYAFLILVLKVIHHIISLIILWETRVRALSGGVNNFKVNEIEVYKIEFI